VQDAIKVDPEQLVSSEDTCSQSCVAFLPAGRAAQRSSLATDRAAAWLWVFLPTRLCAPVAPLPRPAGIRMVATHKQQTRGCFQNDDFLCRSAI
jgi:hypothetical protein